MKNINFQGLPLQSCPPGYGAVMLNVVKKSKVETHADNCNNSLAKRVFDIVVSLMIFILVFSWLFPIIAFFIKITSKGSAFYTQKRVGQNGEILRIYKFRTMVHNAPMLDESGKFIQSVKNDDRVTWIGNFLRKTSMDELPQFINVLQGNMSMIGPRPHVPHLEDHFDIHIENYEMRTLVKPGITGLAQVKGLRGVTEGPQDMQNRVRMDIVYIKKWNFWLDMKIFFGTIYVVFTGDKNAY